MQRVQQEVATLLAEQLGGPCAVYLVSRADPPLLKLGAVYHAEPSVAAALRDLLGETVQTSHWAFGRVLNDWQPLLVPDLNIGLPHIPATIPDAFRHAGLVSLLAVPLAAASGSLGLLVCVAGRDRRLDESDLSLAVGVGELVMVALDISRSETKLRESLRVRDMSISVASHELRNALATMRALVQMSLRALRKGDPESLGRVEHHLETMTRQVDCLTELARDVLDVTRIDTGRMELRKVATSLNSIVAGVIERFQGVVTEHTRHRLRAELPNLQLVGVWDRDRIDQVLTNLLANAIKYSPKGGLVTVRVERRESARVRAGERSSEAREGPVAMVAVSDQGIGIPADELATIFEPYHRGSNVPKEIAGGLGLGLHICKGIVDAHGGEIWAESEVGRGSTFHFVLPLEADIS